MQRLLRLKLKSTPNYVGFTRRNAKKEVGVSIIKMNNLGKVINLSCTLVEDTTIM